MAGVPPQTNQSNYYRALLPSGSPCPSPSNQLRRLDALSTIDARSSHPDPSHVSPGITTRRKKHPTRYSRWEAWEVDILHARFEENPFPIRKKCEEWAHEMTMMRLQEHRNHLSDGEIQEANKNLTRRIRNWFMNSRAKVRRKAHATAKVNVNLEAEQSTSHIHESKDDVTSKSPAYVASSVARVQGQSTYYMCRHRHLVKTQKSDKVSMGSSNNKGVDRPKPKQEDRMHYVSTSGCLMSVSYAESYERGSQNIDD